MPALDDTLEPFRADPTNSRTWKYVCRADALVLQSWLAREHNRPDDLFTGVPVGAIPPTTPTIHTAHAQHHIEALYAKRIDAVILLSDFWFVLEIKPYPRTTALGQALLYTALARRRYPVLFDAQPVILCAAPDPDLYDLAPGLWQVHIWRDPTADFWRPDPNLSQLTRPMPNIQDDSGPIVETGPVT